LYFLVEFDLKACMSDMPPSAFYAWQNHV